MITELSSQILKYKTQITESLEQLRKEENPYKSEKCKLALNSIKETIEQLFESIANFEIKELKNISNKI